MVRAVLPDKSGLEDGEAGAVQKGVFAEGYGQRHPEAVADPCSPGLVSSAEKPEPGLEGQGAGKATGLAKEERACWLTR